MKGEKGLNTRVDIPHRPTVGEIWSSSCRSGLLEHSAKIKKAKVQSYISRLYEAVVRVA
jgi:hypothetical protein